MGCCGQKRSSLQAMMPGVVPGLLPRSGVVTATSVGTGRTVPETSSGLRHVTLRYRERARVRVLGPVTRRPYEFSPEQPTQSVDTRDAEALLRTRQFLHA